MVPRFLASRTLLQAWDTVWQSTGTVPDKLTRLPDNNLFMGYPGLRIFPNQTVTTDQVTCTLSPYSKLPYVEIR
jgi:hypothetical protein